MTPQAHSPRRALVLDTNVVLDWLVFARSVGAALALHAIGQRRAALDRHARPCATNWPMVLRRGLLASRAGDSARSCTDWRSSSV